MKRPFSYLLLGVAALCPIAHALSPSDIPADTPISHLIKSANVQLAAGNAQDALTYLDTAVARDPQNYLNIFKRGAAYLSLGKNVQAQRDFDKVLSMKPDFEGALVQRAKLKARNGEWDAARKDYLAAGKRGSPELADLDEAQGAAILAEEAAKAGNWDDCIQQAGIAIVTAGTLLDLRKLRARCRFEKGEVAEGVNDLQHVLQISSGSTEPYMQISATMFYSMGEADKALAQIRRCLQSDPDSKQCRKLMKREKALDKSMKKLHEAFERRQFAAAVHMLLGSKDEPGLVDEVQQDIKSYKQEGVVHQNSPEGLHIKLTEMVCEAYIEVRDRKVRGQAAADVGCRWTTGNAQRTTASGRCSSIRRHFLVSCQKRGTRSMRKDMNQLYPLSTTRKNTMATIRGSRR